MAMVLNHSYNCPFSKGATEYFLDTGHIMISQKITTNDDTEISFVLLDSALIADVPRKSLPASLPIVCVEIP